MLHAMNVSNSTTQTQERILLIGGSGGIGRALGRALRARGAELVLAARDPARLASAATELDAEHHALDATRMEDVMSLVARLTAERPLTGLVNLAGAILLKPAHRTSEDEWQHVLAQNLTTAFATVRAAGQHMRAVDGRPASVVLVTTAASLIGLTNHEAVAASKAGISGLVRAAAATSARRGLRFNAVAPGLTRTPLAGALATDPKLVEASTRMHPLGRIGEPEDVASAIAWLLHPDNSWVTGQVLAVDGGLSTLKPPG